VFELSEKGKDAEALEIATREQDWVDDYPELVYHFRACLTALLHQDAEQVVAVLKEGMGEHSWYLQEGYRDDSDLDSVRG
jgi:hypothetical protein